jgi:hypothetical protein
MADTPEQARGWFSSNYPAVRKSVRFWQAFAASGRVFRAARRRFSSAEQTPKGQAAQGLAGLYRACGNYDTGRMLHGENAI